MVFWSLTLTEHIVVEILPCCISTYAHSSFYCLIAAWYLIFWMYKYLFIHSQVDGHLDCFQVFAVRDKTAINVCVHILCEQMHFLFLLSKYLGGGPLGCVNSTDWTLQGTVQLLSKVSAPWCFSIGDTWKLQTLHIPANTCDHVFHWAIPMRVEWCSHLGFFLSGFGLLYFTWGVCFYMCVVHALAKTRGWHCMSSSTALFLIPMRQGLSAPEAYGQLAIDLLGSACVCSLPRVIGICSHAQLLLHESWGFIFRFFHLA